MTKLITSALPYANGPIHIGHLVEYIQTDIFVRFLKSNAIKVKYLCADDTHGTPIQLSAEKEGILPEELISRYHKQHLESFKKFKIHFDSYYSTNSDENKHFSDLIFSRLKEKGYIYENEVEQAYCNKCAKFLPDRYIKGKCPKCGQEDQYGDVCENCNATYDTTDLVEPYCTICGETPVRKKSHHYFFKLSEFSDKLSDWFDKNKKLQPEITNYLKNWLSEGLKDWDISRDGPYFGFKIPDSDNLYYYVWLDAPIGYISSLANTLSGNVELAEKEWNESSIMHFIGKDIIYFHFLFWPAVLMAADFKVPDEILVHGFLTVNGEKMSKSRGTFYTADDFATKYNPEYLRFYYAKVLSRKLNDIDLSLSEFREVINNELVGNVGNFCYRVLSFCNKYFDSAVGEIDDVLIEDVTARFNDVQKAYSDVNLNEAIREILLISDIGNRYFQASEPWKLINEDKEKAHRVVGACVNLVKNLSILLAPVLPDFASQIQGQLGLDLQDWNDLNWEFTNTKIGNAQIILDKVEEIPEEDSSKEVEFEVDPEVEKLGLQFAVAQIDGIQVKKKSEGLQKLKKSLKHQDLEGNKIYEESKKVNGDPSLEPPYAHLISIIRDKGHLPTINTVVDAYNLGSIKHLVSVGAHDLSKFSGKVRFGITGGSEIYTPLGSDRPVKVKSGEYACLDDKEILCRLDVKQCEGTKVDIGAKSIMVYVQGNKENDNVRAALKDICDTIIKYNGGSYKIIGEEEKFPLDLKVGKILSVKEHPEADKLFIEEVDMCTEKRTIVSGLKDWYKADDLVGKNIIVVSNLKPAKLRGVKSEGMLLAAEHGKDVKVIFVDADPGTPVVFGELSNDNAQIKIEQFSKIKMSVKTSNVVCDDRVLSVNGKPIYIDMPDGSEIH